MNSIRRSKIPKFEVKTIEKPSYVINQSQLHRFDSKSIIFDRVTGDSSWEGHLQMYDERVPDIVSEGKLGYSRLDFALAYASWIVHDAFKGGFSCSI